MDASIEGYLLISDITGYTAYLNHSELEHAQDSLKSLLEVLIEQTKLPLQISRLEGDAIISYVPSDGYLQGQSLVDMIENTYVTFRRALELMVLNTSCNCSACKNLKNLDLKFFVHFGKFALHKLELYTELIGNDVNTIHRLTKNSVFDNLGFKAYVLYTRAAINALKLPGMISELSAHKDFYEHIGEIEYFVADMHNIWEQERKKRKLSVNQEEASFEIQFDVPFPPARFWDYFTHPEYFAVMFGADSINQQNLKNGRIQSGSKLICAHGNKETEFTIIDWQPFDQFTITNSIYKGSRVKSTYKFTPSKNGTNLEIRFGQIEGGFALLNKVMLGKFKKKLPVDFQEKYKFLLNKIQQEVSLRPETNLPQQKITEESISSSVLESLSM